MALEYIQLFVDMEELFEPFDDAQRGRLMTAMMAYAFRGERPEFEGVEKFGWPALKQHIDRCMANVEAKRSAGSKGGKGKQSEADASNVKQSEADESNAKQTQADASRSKQSEAEASRAKQTQAEASKAKQNAHIQEQEHIQEHEQEQYVVSNARARAGDEMTDDELHAYRKEQAEVEAAARRVGLPVSADADMHCMDTLRAEHGSGNLLKAIARIEGAAEKSRNWRYVSGILRREKAAGYPWREKPPDDARSGGRDQMQRHQYTQEDYDAMVIDLDEEGRYAV